MSPNPSTNGTYTVSWQSVSGATSYVLGEAANGGTEVTYPINSSGGAPAPTSWTPPAAKANGSYVYRVKACAGTCGNYSGTTTETVQIASGSLTINPVTSTTGTYTVSWAAVPGAASYVLTESVKACNTAGCSAYRASSAVKVQLPNVLPERMSIGGMASPNPSTNGLYTVSWSASARATRYELQEMSVDPTWVTISTTLTGTSWTPPTPKANGYYYYYRGRACNVYGCSEYSVSSQTAVVQIPAPVTTPTGFRVMGSGAVNQAYKFFWDPVSGASHYTLKEEQYSCPTAADAIILIPANEAQPYKLIGWVPPCNGQPRTSVTYWYSLQACNGSACSGWTPTVMYTVTDGPPLRPAGSTTTYVHTDGLRSPIATTNELKAVTLRMRYEPYGAPTNGIHPKGPGYAGHVEDAATGLVYMQQRYYDPLAGRFLSTDPIAASAASFNRYWYANNNPYRYIDPDGRQAIDDKLKESTPPTLDAVKVTPEKSSPSPAQSSAAVTLGTIAVTASRAVAANPAAMVELATVVVNASRVGGPAALMLYSKPLGSAACEMPGEGPCGMQSKAFPKGYLPGDVGAEEWGRRNGVDKEKARRKFHGIKQSDTAHKGGKQDWGVNPVTGDVIDPEGQSHGSLGD